MLVYKEYVMKKEYAMKTCQAHYSEGQVSMNYNEREILLWGAP